MLAGVGNIWNIYIYIEYLSTVGSFMLKALLMTLE